MDSRSRSSRSGGSTKASRSQKGLGPVVIVGFSVLARGTAPLLVQPFRAGWKARRRIRGTRRRTQPVRGGSQSAGCIGRSAGQYPQPRAKRKCGARHFRSSSAAKPRRKGDYIGKQAPVYDPKRGCVSGPVRKSGDRYVVGSTRKRKTGSAPHRCDSIIRSDSGEDQIPGTTGRESGASTRGGTARRAPSTSALCHWLQRLRHAAAEPEAQPLAGDTLAEYRQDRHVRRSGLAGAALRHWRPRSLVRTTREIGFFWPRREYP